jgi:L-fuconolactonase
MVSATQTMAAFVPASECDLSREVSLRTWLAQHTEAPVEPELPILDCHHHLMDHREPLGQLRPVEDARPTAFRMFLGATTPMYGCRYMAEEFAEDIASSGHNICGTVYTEASSFYATDGPESLRPVGETQFAQGVAAMTASGRYGPTKMCAGIVSFADCGLGREIEPVLRAHAASPNFRGIRHSVQWDPHPQLQFRADAAPRRLYDGQFREGMAALARHGLTYDVSLFHHQLVDLADAARALPELTIVLNHCGHALGVGPYSSVSQRATVWKEWRAGISELARCSNVVCKIGGRTQPGGGFGFDRRPVPPTSDEVAEALGPWCAMHRALHRTAVISVRIATVWLLVHLCGWTGTTISLLSLGPTGVL